MGRPRTPTNVLELRGAFRKDPQRARPDEPTPSGPLGAPPKRFRPELVEIWEELQEIAPAGVLGNADRWLVELICQLMARFRMIGIEDTNGIGIGCTGTELNLLVSCLSRMGMTPSDRSKVGVQTPKQATERDELAELAREVGLRPN